MNPEDALRIIVGIVGMLAAVGVLIRVFAFAFDRQSKRLDENMRLQTEDYRSRINLLEKKVDNLSADVDQLKDVNHQLQRKVETQEAMIRDRDKIILNLTDELKMERHTRMIYEGLFDRLEVKVKPEDGTHAEESPVST
jgi:predicted RNase H-like nuclease (RuvC/YqgF family)